MYQACINWLERCLYTQLPAPNSLNKWSPQSWVIQRSARRSTRTCMGVFDTENIVAGSHPDQQGECTTLSPTPHPLLLLIWSLHSLAHHMVISQLAKALSSSSLCSRKCTTAQETAGTSSCGKPIMNWVTGRALHHFWQAGQQEELIGYRGLNDKNTSQRAIVSWKRQHKGSCPFFSAAIKGLF